MSLQFQYSIHNWVTLKDKLDEAIQELIETDRSVQPQDERNTTMSLQSQYSIHNWVTLKDILDEAIQELIETDRSVQPQDERNMSAWIETIRDYNADLRVYLPSDNFFDDQ